MSSSLKDLRDRFSTPPEDVKKAEELESLKLRLSSLIKDRDNLKRLVEDYAHGGKWGSRLDRTTDLLDKTNKEIERLKSEISNLEGKGREFSIGARFSFEPKGLKRLNEIAEGMRGAFKKTQASMSGFSKAMKLLGQQYKLTSAELEYIRAQIAPIPDFMKKLDGRWVMRQPPDHPHCRTEIEPVELTGDSITKEDLNKFFESLPRQRRAPHMSPEEKKTKEILTKLIKLKVVDRMLGTGIERAMDAGDTFTQDLLAEQRRQVFSDRSFLDEELARIAHDVPEPEEKARVKDLRNELTKMGRQMETLSASMNKAIDGDDWVSEPNSGDLSQWMMMLRPVSKESFLEEDSDEG